jgi:hypothetical protein
MASKLWVIGILMVCLAAAPAMAYIGTLGPTTSDGLTYDPSTSPYGDWYGRVTFEWDVYQLTSGPWQGLWMYDYTFSLAEGWHGALSSFYLETSPDFSAANIMDWGGGAEGIDINSWSAGTSGLPGAMTGIKFVPWPEPANGGDPISYNMWLISNREPIWGDFFAKDGSVGGDVYNSGFGDPNPTAPFSTPYDDSSVFGHVLVPDTTEYFRTPELSTWMLLGLSALAGVFVTCRRRKS